MVQSILSVQRDIHYIQSIKDKLYERAGNGSETLRAGTTYIGQMLAHEIVGSDSRRIKRSPIINMESLYGRKSERFLNEDGLFELGYVQMPSGEILHGADLPISKETGKVSIADIRNEKNIFISQLHLLWMKLHNSLMGGKNKNGAARNQYKLRELIKEVQYEVTEKFKNIVVNEFLKNVIHPDVLKGYESLKNPKALLLSNVKMDTLPSFFSTAALRIGHSMVRHNYCVGDNRFSLSLLLNHRGRGRQISNEMLFNWEQIFGDNAQKALRIDLNIARDMGNIPGGLDVVELNLLADYRSGTPSAINLYDYISTQKSYLNEIGIEELFNDFAPNKIVTSQRADIYKKENLPLWVYILMEAGNMVNARRAGMEGTGEYLGVLGSILLIEVVIKSFGENGLEFFKKSMKQGIGMLEIIKEI